jgi:hypothetical protein
VRLIQLLKRMRSKGYLRPCVMRCGFGEHLNRFSVFPRVCRTDVTQIAMARDSFFFLDLSCFNVLRTFLIQEQSFRPSMFYQAL